MLKLDFSLKTSKERNLFAQKYIEENPNLTKSELETISDYILYGKDEDGESVVDRKEVQIKTKYSSYNKKEPESLNELIENPNFDERVFQTEKNSYRYIKPKIDRKLDSDIHNIKELWEVIDYYQYLIDVNTGKIIDPAARTLTPLQLYKIKHMVIDLRRQQFYLRDIEKPTICMFGTTARKPLTSSSNENNIIWDFEGSDFAIAPLGVLVQKDAKFYDPRNYIGPDYKYNTNAKYIIDFRNSEHIYILIEHYEDLRVGSTDKPEATIGLIADTLDFYREKAKLGEVKELILQRKIERVPNLEIQKELEEKFGITHSVNYISTIYRKNICEEIAAAARLHYDYYLNRNEPFMWKKCNQCGKIKLKDTREFMRKSRSSDGLASKCKECDKENRKKQKK